MFVFWNMPLVSLKSEGNDIRKKGFSLEFCNCSSACHFGPLEGVFTFSKVPKWVREEPLGVYIIMCVCVYMCMCLLLAVRVSKFHDCRVCKFSNVSQAPSIGPNPRKSLLHIWWLYGFTILLWFLKRGIKAITYWASIMCQTPSKLPLIIHNNPLREIVLFPFYRWENWNL